MARAGTPWTRDAVRPCWGRYATEPLEASMETVRIGSLAFPKIGESQRTFVRRATTSFQSYAISEGSALARALHSSRSWRRATLTARSTLGATIMVPPDTSPTTFGTEFSYVIVQGHLHLEGHHAL